MKLISQQAAAELMGYSTTRGLNYWISKHDNRHPDRRVVRVGKKVCAESLERAVLRMNGQDYEHSQ